MKKFILFLLFIPLIGFSQFNSGKYWHVTDVNAYDPDGGEIVYSITAGNTGGYFVVTPCTGILKVDTNAYSVFTYQKTYTLTVKVADMEGNFVKGTIKVVLKKVNGIKQQPIIISQTQIIT